jgi:hypothetical protein
LASRTSSLDPSEYQDKDDIGPESIDLWLEVSRKSRKKDQLLVTQEAEAGGSQVQAKYNKKYKIQIKGLSMVQMAECLSSNRETLIQAPVPQKK